jgi:hypothetical protein
MILLKCCNNKKKSTKIIILKQIEYLLCKHGTDGLTDDIHGWKSGTHLCRICFTCLFTRRRRHRHCTPPLRCRRPQPGPRIPTNCGVPCRRTTKANGIDKIRSLFEMQGNSPCTAPKRVQKASEASMREYGGIYPLVIRTKTCPNQKQHTTTTIGVARPHIKRNAKRQGSPR